MSRREYVLLSHRQSLIPEGPRLGSSNHSIRSQENSSSGLPTELKLVSQKYTGVFIDIYTLYCVICIYFYFIYLL